MSNPRIGGGYQLHQTLNGSPTFLGVITATTTQNNHDTAVPFNDTSNALMGKVLLLQADSACYIYVGTTNAVTAIGTATGNGLFLNSGERLILTMGESQGWVACVPYDETTNLKVWELN